MENTCEYSDNWQPYIGDYDKFEYDVKLKSGEVIEKEFTEFMDLKPIK